MTRKLRRTEPIIVDLETDTGYEDVAKTRWFRRLFQHALQVRRIDVRTPKAEGDELDDGEIAGDFCVRTEENDDPEQDPVILLHCADGALTTQTDVMATITLAHELGHHESWLQGDCIDDVYTIMMDDDGNADAPEELRRAWLEEEERAWRYGRAILREAIPEFPASDLFDRTAIDAIEGPDGYRRGLGF